MKTRLCVYMCQFMFLKVAKKEGYWHYPYASFEFTKFVFTGKLFTQAPTGLDYECFKLKRHHQILDLNKRLQYWAEGSRRMHNETARSGLVCQKTCIILTFVTHPSNLTCRLSRLINTSKSITISIRFK